MKQRSPSKPCYDIHAVSVIIPLLPSPTATVLATRGCSTTPKSFLLHRQNRVTRTQVYSLVCIAACVTIILDLSVSFIISPNSVWTLLPSSSDNNGLPHLSATDNSSTLNLDHQQQRNSTLSEGNAPSVPMPTTTTTRPRSSVPSATEEAIKYLLQQSTITQFAARAMEAQFSSHYQDGPSVLIHSGPMAEVVV